MQEETVICLKYLHTHRLFMGYRIPNLKPVDRRLLL